VTTDSTNYVAIRIRVISVIRSRWK